MIYTTTLNPSIDYVMRAESIQMGGTNRAYYDNKIPGGKGTMVSKLLKALGHETVNIGFIGGFPGVFVADCLKHMGIEEVFTRIADDTRINVKLKTDDNVETEINAKGPNITKEEIAHFFSVLDQVQEGDIVALSGSIPHSLPGDFYLDIVKVISDKKATFTIDTTGAVLLESLKYKPLLIKPNQHELGAIFEKELLTPEQILPYGIKCLEMGAQHVIVSMGKDGAMFFHEGGAYYALGVKGTLVNSVGAGDSMIGGFIAGLAGGLSSVDAFRLAVASGSATAFSEDIGSRELIERIYEQVTVTKID